MSSELGTDWVMMGTLMLICIFYQVWSLVTNSLTGCTDQGDVAEVLSPRIIMNLYLWSGVNHVLEWPTCWHFCNPGFFWVKDKEEIAVVWQTFPVCSWLAAKSREQMAKWVRKLKRCFVKPSSLNWHRLPSCSPLSQLGLSFVTDVS